MSESDQQAEVVRWWRMQYPDLTKMLIPSQSGVMVGGKNKFAIIAKQKREGWIGGVPDIMISVARGGFHGLFIEMKDANKTKSSVSKDQLAYLDELSKQGYATAWAAGSENAIKIIKEYMNEQC